MCVQAGLGSLFSALVLFNADYHSLGVHFKPVCLVSLPIAVHGAGKSRWLASLQDGGCTKVGIELMQTLTVVFAPSINSKGYTGMYVHVHVHVPC